MSGRYGRVIVTLGGLILALALAGNVEGQQARQPPAAESYAAQQSTQPARSTIQRGLPGANRCKGAEPNEGEASCYNRRATEAAERQAYWAKAQTWVGLAGAAFVVLTLLYTARAANAAKKAAEVIPVLERAYLYPLIKRENISDTLDLATRIHQQPNMFPKGFAAIAKAEVVFKNFGKTPATLVYGEVRMGVIGVSRVDSLADLPIKYRYVLAEGEESEPFPLSIDPPLAQSEVDGIVSGEYGIRVGGFMNYRDIWGNEQGCPVSFSYNTVLKRLDAYVGPYERPEHGRALSRLLPSHWWAGRKA